MFFLPLSHEMQMGFSNDSYLTPNLLRITTEMSLAITVEIKTLTRSLICADFNLSDQVARIASNK